jgi:hypothetical protein
VPAPYRAAALADRFGSVIAEGAVLSPEAAAALLTWT